MKQAKELFEDRNRIEALLEYDILNTTSEEKFDNLAKLIAITCDVPIAVISFMDNKNQYFKACYGTDETERLIEHSFCQHIVEYPNEVTEISNTHEDARVYQNPFVINTPNLLFYAGYPLFNAEGYLLGSICIHDFKVKKLNENRKESLKIIGNQIIELLELRKNKIILNKEKDTLLSQNKKTENIIDISGLGTWEWNIKTNACNFNKEWANMLGYELSELEPLSFQTWYDLLHPNELASASENVYKAFVKEDTSLNHVFRMRKKDGSYLWIQSKGKTIKRDINGKPLIIIGTHLNINRRKMAQLQLKRMNENIPAAVFRYVAYNNGTDKFLHYNKKLNQLYDLPKDLRLEGDNINLVWNKIHPDDISIVQAAVEKSKNELSEYKVEYRIICDDNSTKWLSANGSIFSSNETETIWDTVVFDITKQYERNEKLMRLNKELNLKSKELTLSNTDLEQFAYVASHDLQEPLRMITSFLTLLEKKYGDELDDKAKTYIHYAVDGAKRMRAIILDLLNYSRVGKLKNKATEININDLVNEIITINNRIIKHSNASIQLEALPTITSYTSELFQVFSNLIGNALKYQMPNKKPVITISSKDVKTHWEFSIEDNGIGLDEKYFEQVFVIFKRLHNKEKYSGNGIGLAISKKIVNSLGGEIWIENVKKQGSIFKFTIKKI